MQILMKCFHGSRLYGLETETSDTDYKYVYMPTLRQLILNDYEPVIEKSSAEQNGPDDVDETWYALPRFIQMAIASSPTAIEMLHANFGSTLIQTSPLWNSIVAQRTSFYTSNISNLMDFANNQAKRYSLKLNVYTDMLELKQILDNQEPKIRLHRLRMVLPDTETSYWSTEMVNGEAVEFYNILEKRFYSSAFCKDVLVSLKATLRRYGARVKAAQEAGSDWKSVSHAARALYQTIEILEHGDFNYPLKETPTLMKLKLGKMAPDEVTALMDGLTVKVKNLIDAANLPENVNKEYWEDFIVQSAIRSHRLC